MPENQSPEKPPKMAKVENFFIKKLTEPTLQGDDAPIEEPQANLSDKSISLSSSTQSNNNKAATIEILVPTPREEEKYEMISPIKNYPPIGLAKQNKKNNSPKKEFPASMKKHTSTPITNLAPPVKNLIKIQTNSSS